MGADQTNGAAAGVALDFRDHFDPPHLAVVRANDSVGRGIVFTAALERVQEMLDGGLAILGMDPVDPILMGFVFRVGRQPVDDEIFGRAPVPKPFAEIDFDAADPGDALDPRQFRFAFLQRAMRPVAFARNLLQVLPQFFGSNRFRKEARWFRSCHSACKFTLLSHR